MERGSRGFEPPFFTSGCSFHHGNFGHMFTALSANPITEEEPITEEKQASLTLVMWSGASD